MGSIGNKKNDVKKNDIQKNNNRSNNVLKKASLFILFLVVGVMYLNISVVNSSADLPMPSQETTVEEATTVSPQAHLQSKSNERVQRAAVKPLQDANIDKVFVDKSEQRLHLMEDGVIIKSYHVAMGDNPKGHKQQQGDERTPEGSYVLDYKNENSIAYRSIHISYPNAADKARAAELGVDPGGDIMIHGQMNGYGDLAAINQLRNWTDGCLAVTDAEMDEIMDAVAVGTPIEIVW